MATSSVIVLRAIWMTLAAAQKPADRLFERLGIERSLLADIETRVPFELVIRAWAVAAELAGDDHFGLHFGERISIGAFDVVDYAARSCATLGDALIRLVRYRRLLHDAVYISLETEGDDVTIVHRMVGAHGPGVRHATEASLSSYVARGRALTGVDLTPRAVRFAHAAPADVSELGRVFRSPLTFNAPTDQLVIAASDLALPLEHDDAALREILDRQAEAMIERLPPTSGSFAPEVARALLPMIPDGEPRIADVAARLGMSARSLQRKLAAEGESFTMLVDRVRRDLALRYLENAHLPMRDVAFLVGFSEPSAFSRAYRRWMGHPPTQRPR